jgi:hypothetical protein
MVQFALMFTQCEIEQDEGVMKSDQTEPSYNPMVTHSTITPNPLPFSGRGKLSFYCGNSGRDSIPVVEGQELTMIITLSHGVPATYKPLDALCGVYIDYFDWSYNALNTTYFAKQKKTLPPAMLGDVNIQFQSTHLKSSANGFNCNLQTPAFTHGYNNQDDDYVNAYTYCEQVGIPGPITYLENWTGIPYNTMVDFSVRIADFKKVGAISLVMKYDPAVLEFKDIIKVANIPNFMAVAINSEIRMSAYWSSNDSLLTLPDDAVLFQIKYLYKGSPETTFLTWNDDDGASCEYAGGSPEYIPFVDIPFETYYLAGSVTGDISTGIREIKMGSWDGTIPVTRIQARRTGNKPDRINVTSGTRNNSKKSKRR